MKRIILEIIFVIVVIAVTVRVYDAYFVHSEDVVVTDTVYVDVPYEVEVIREREVPVTVIEYETITDTITVLEQVHDTVFVNDNQYHSAFLTQYPHTHRFLGLHFNEEFLNLTTQSPSGQTESKIWYVGSDNYRISSNLSIRRTPRSVSRLGFYGEGGWIHYIDGGSPYGEFGGQLRIFGKYGITSSININKNPHVKIGVRYAP